MNKSCSHNQANKTLINIPTTLNAIQVAKFMPVALGKRLNFPQICNYLIFCFVF